MLESIKQILSNFKEADVIEGIYQLNLFLKEPNRKQPELRICQEITRELEQIEKRKLGELSLDKLEHYRAFLSNYLVDRLGNDLNLDAVAIPKEFWHLCDDEPPRTTELEILKGFLLKTCYPVVYESLSGKKTPGVYVGTSEYFEADPVVHDLLKRYKQEQKQKEQKNDAKK